MSMAIKNFYGVEAPAERGRNLRILFVICGLIAAPSVVLAIVMTGWAQYLFAVVIAINVAVPVVAYVTSSTPPPELPEEEYGFSRGPQITVEQITVDDITDPANGEAPVERVTDQV